MAALVDCVHAVVLLELVDHLIPRLARSAETMQQQDGLAAFRACDLVLQLDSVVEVRPGHAGDCTTPAGQAPTHGSRRGRGFVT